MTSDIVTRAEKAIRANRHNTTEVQAREAIRAIREASDAMIVAGDERILAHLNSHELTAATPTPAQTCFTAMIDEALKP